ncbi:fatty acid hydroxylase domain-containing protein 2 [Daphnia magna]|uniref:fatty acid hydroxylase domain-containing protein 2 n=1 Tax=Daphnia magna TaxID=35525 RepID=UPI0014036460|nr:fatty acid hydroxylase domain-containing protein 2 [Daphnia magna]
MELKQSALCQKSLLLVTTLLLIPIFYGHTVTTHLRELRAVSGAILESSWEAFLQLVGEDDYNLYVWGITLSVQIPFWAIGIFFMIVDYYNWPKWFRKYKLQPGTNEPVDLNKLLETVKVVLINQWAISYPLTIVSYYFKKATNTTPIIHGLPTIEQALLDFTILFICEEIGVYYVHRLVHHPKLYITVHKKHHEWRAPVAIASMYSTPIEYLLLLGAAAVGPLIVNPHTALLWFWYAFVHLRSVNEHTGYKFPWLPFSDHHDYHHIMNNACFSHSYFLDWLHGTDKGFRAYVSRKKSSKQID